MPSVHDNFADALEVEITTDGGTYTSPSLDTAGNTTESGEVSTSASSNASSWFSYTPVTSGTATFDTELTTITTSGTDTFMAIWTGTNFGDMVLVASDDDSGASGNTSRIEDLTVNANETYWIQIGGFGAQTFNLVLRVTGEATVSTPDGSVNAVPFNATASFPVHTVSGGAPGDGEVIAEPFTASAELKPPSSVSGESSISGGQPFNASAQFLAPVVTGNVDSPNGEVLAVPFTASSDFRNPVVWDGVIPDITFGQGETRQDNAVRRLRAAGFTGSLQDMQRAFLLDQFGGTARHSVADLQIQFAELDQVYDILPDSVLPGV